MDDDRDYCLDCAEVMVVTAGVYPAGQRAEEREVQQLLRDRLRLLTRGIPTQTISQSPAQQRAS